MLNKKQGFTLIELLIVIAIIGLLASLAIISLNSSRASARDVSRLSDIRQMRSALELHSNTYGDYPDSSNFQAVHEVLSANGVGGLGEFITPVPEAPLPADGDCSSEENTYKYKQIDGGASYQISYCLGSAVNNVEAGFSYASPSYIQISASGD